MTSRSNCRIKGQDRGAYCILGWAHPLMDAQEPPNSSHQPHNPSMSLRFVELWAAPPHAPHLLMPRNNCLGFFRSLLYMRQLYHSWIELR